MNLSNTEELPDPGDKNPVDLDERIGIVLQAWLERREERVAEDAEQLIMDHPELAPRLRACVESIDLLSGVATSIDAEQQACYPKIPDFEILGTLGRGGMGVVYEAKQLSLDRVVALKVLPLGTVNPLTAKRFQREAETAASLHHTHIVPIYAVGQHKGVHWYAMQRIVGLPLNQAFREHTDGVEIDEVVRIGVEAAEALEHAHHHGVLHRDIKPGNLLIEPEGHVWLTDFGLARRDADVTATVSGAILGTPRYMSPEQVFAPAGQSLDFRSDIYSLGATLFELATGTPLFDGPTPLDVLQQIRTFQAPSPRSIQARIPRDLDVVLKKCLEKDPNNRYQSAGDLADDLCAIRDGRPIKARGVPLWEVARRKLIRHRERVKFAVGMVMATAILLLGSAIVWRGRQEARKGMVRIVSPGGPFIASVYRMGDAVDPIATVTVPMQDPLVLDEASYQVRLAGEDQHSSLSRFDVSAGQLTRGLLVNRSEPFDAFDAIEIEGKELWLLRGDSPGEELLATIDAANARWAVDLGGRELTHLHESPHHPPLAELRSDKDVVCLVDLFDGREVWRSVAEIDRLNQRSLFEEPTPRVQGNADGYSIVHQARDGIRSTTIRDPSPSSELRNALARLPPQARDRRFERLSPMSPFWGGNTVRSTLSSIVIGIAQTCLAILLPLGYLVHAVRKRSFSLLYLLLAPVVVVFAMLTWQSLLDPSKSLSSDPNVRQGWPITLIAGLFLTAALYALTHLIVRKNYIALGGIFLVACCLTSASAVIPILFQRMSREGQWYTITVADIAFLFVMMLLYTTLFGFPIVKLVQWIRKITGRVSHG
ncbi:serine/threonine-protein kinase [Novipirellula artificiosorum]|uniref:Serine/threonine-protein kinase PknB n=1 Tax=Novipirellula artificiosorum TaxID=2528016 RepID=A0A5C6E2J6_9BACT|nr:serine/threonine-protein kinase [Novipirellula artificiosorum]TWU42724.1 Serine/threonine-protein kinase PknB [Novipirellula artificiosorum]